MSDAFRIRTVDYVRAGLARQGLRDWLQAGPDYSRAVEYPLAADLLRARPGERLLDVGAGRRAEFAQHAAAAGLVVTAIDLRDDLGVECPASAGITFTRADAKDLPFEDGSFDHIVAISTLEHIEHEEQQAVAELARVLAPGGRLVISVPFNPLRSGEVHKPEGVYGRVGPRVFFEHLYDEDRLQQSIIAPTGLELAGRVNLAEPGFKLSRLYYEPRSAVMRPLRFRVPWGPLFGLAAPRFLRSVTVADYDGDDWIGAPVVLLFHK